MLTKFCFSTLRPKIRFKNRPTSVASLSFTTKVVSVKPMDIRHCYDRKKNKHENTRTAHGKSAFPYNDVKVNVK